MYPLLPTMKGVHVELMAQVMQELKELYRDDEVSLTQQYTWMMLLLERTDTIGSLEKEKIQEYFTMFDQLWDESPRVKKMKEQVRVQVREQTRRETLQQALVSLVHARFPDLTEFAQQQVEAFNEPAALDLLIQKIATAPDAKTARWLLDSSAEVQE